MMKIGGTPDYFCLCCVLNHFHACIFGVQLCHVLNVGGSFAPSCVYLVSSIPDPMAKMSAGTGCLNN